MPQLVKDFTTIVDDNNSPSYNIGVLYDNVYMESDFNSNTFIENNKPKTLRTFYKSMKEFFQRQMHMIYQKDEPENRGIVEWYEVTMSLEGNEQTNNPNDENTYVSPVPGMSSNVDKTSNTNNNG